MKTNQKNKKNKNKDSLKLIFFQCLETMAWKIRSFEI